MQIESILAHSDLLLWERVDDFLMYLFDGDL